MAQVTGAFPYDIDNLLGGAVRVLYAPSTVAVPTNIADVIEMVAPYTPKTGWLDLGATRDGFSYSRGFDVEGYEIQQVAGPILEEVTDITRTVTASAAEFTPEILRILEEAGTPGAQAAAAGISAQEILKFGGFTTTTKYRIAFISRRHKGSGLVTEPGGATRGRFVMGAAYNAQMTADETEIEQEKGTLSAFGLTFRMFPEPGQTEGQEYGLWAFENIGTIT
jgi:hypothetical protein